MLPATEGVVLQRVTLRGAMEAIDSARAPLKTALEQNSWPATAPGELLLLRRISASGNPREIAARAADQARRLADNAVDGWSLSAPDALAVRFRSHASLLACLIRDLLQGTAPRHWYWRRWQSVLQRPADEAITTLLQEEPLHLPAIVAQLRTTTVWRAFWQTLGSSGAERLLIVTAQAAGWATTVQSARALIASLGVSAEQPLISPAIFTQNSDLGFLGVGANDSRPLLAALLALWQQAPTLLTQAAGAKQLYRLARIISGEAPTTLAQPGSPDGVKRNPGSQSPDSTAVHPGYGAAQHEQPIATSEPLHRHSAPPPVTVEKLGEVTPPPLNPAMPEGVVHTGASPRVEITSQGAVATTESGHKKTPETTIYSENIAHDFITQQGGILYLLNLLNLSTVRAQLPADQPGAGWRWLHDLATALGCPPEARLLEFLATECGMESGVELTAQPPLAPMEQLLRLGASRYGDEVWQADTWRVPARLIASASHVDLHFRLNDVRLPVRRVGLDINPGWLPWLGRVVTFHYGSGLEP